MQKRLLFDIGANKGQYTDANAAKYDQVVLVDANPDLCAFLRNKYRHQQDKYVTENVIVSNEKAVPFYMSSTADTISTASQRWVQQSRFTGNQKWQPSRDPIPCMSLNDLIAKYGRPAYIKIDVEGYEYNVLQSLSLDAKHAPIPLAFEWAEEMLDEILLSVAYLAEKLLYTQFAVQMEDSYTHQPPKDHYMSLAQVQEFLESALIPARQFSWGMIHCR